MAFEPDQIYCVKSPTEKYEPFSRLMDFAGLGDEVRGLPKSTAIYIKPNFMVFVHKRYINYTSPTLVRFLLDYLHDAGRVKVFLIESQSMYSVAFDNFTVKNVLANLGFDKSIVIDLSEEPRLPFRYRGESIEMSSVLNKDSKKFYLIDFPKLKTHNHMGVTLAVKNMYGCLPEPNKYIEFHKKMNLNDAIASIHHFVQPDFVILDAIKGQPKFIDFPRQSDLGRYYRYGYLFAGRNPLLMDEMIGDLMGFDIYSTDVMKQVKHIYKKGTDRYEVVGDQPPILKGFKAYNSFVRNTMMYFVNKLPINTPTMVVNVRGFRKSSAYDKALFKLK